MKLPQTITSSCCTRDAYGSRVPFRTSSDSRRRKACEAPTYAWSAMLMRGRHELPFLTPPPPCLRLSRLFPRDRLARGVALYPSARAVSVGAGQTARVAVHLRRGLPPSARRLDHSA